MRNEVWRVDGSGANASDGNVVWAPTKSIWNNFMLLTAILLGPQYFTLGAFFVFLGLSYLTLLLGHALGMHRCLIHKSFSCPKPFERLLVWQGSMHKNCMFIW